MAERPTTVFEWPGFRVVHDPATGETVTHYPDGTHCGDGQPGADHEYHGALLGMSPALTHLHHELAHHLLGNLAPDSPPDAGGCIIAWRAAHGVEQDEHAAARELLYTALQYASRGLSGALATLDPVRAWGVDPLELSGYHASLFAAVQLGAGRVVVYAPAHL